MPERTDCRVCGQTDLKPVFSLGEQPLANKFVASPNLELAKYPLDLYRCNHCSLMQLGFVVPKEEMYADYSYIPSVSRTYLQHFDELAESAITRFNIQPDSLVVDIGSNDGSLLSCFKSRQMRVLGVEPARKLALSAWEKHQVPSAVDFFDASLAQRLADSHGKARLITATNVFAHVDDLHNFIQGLDNLLTPDGVFFAQFPDARNLLRENQFDTIYHEHLSYFTYEPLHHLFGNSPFELSTIESDNIHGGSMRIWATRRPPLLEQFTEQASLVKQELYQAVLNEKSQGRKVVGFGAAAKGTVLLNYCQLDQTTIDYIADGTPYKQGKFVPGVNIPIYPEERLVTDPPDTVLILAWNFRDEIMQKLQGRGYRYIVPIPKVEVI